MELVKLIASLIGLLSLILTHKWDKDAVKEGKKKELMNEAKKAVKNKDISAINNVAQRLKRMRESEGNA